VSQPRLKTFLNLFSWLFSCNILKQFFKILTKIQQKFQMYSILDSLTTTSRPGCRSFPGVKLLGHEANHSPPSSAEVKNAWNYTPTPPTVFMAWYLIKKWVCHGMVLNWAQGRLYFTFILVSHSVECFWDLSVH